MEIVRDEMCDMFASHTWAIQLWEKIRVGLPGKEKAHQHSIFVRSGVPNLKRCSPPRLLGLDILGAGILADLRGDVGQDHQRLERETELLDAVEAAAAAATLRHS